MNNAERQVSHGCRAWFAAGAIFGMLGVAAAAVAAHLPDRMLEPGGRDLLRDGVQMLGWHAAGLLAAGLWLGVSRSPRLVHLAGLSFVIGTTCFCIGVSVPALGGPHLGRLAPTGGTLLMVGWALLAASAISAGRA